MPDLNEAVLPVIWGLARDTLRGDDVSSRDDLIERLTPHGLIARAETTASRHVGPSVRALEELGVIGAGVDGAYALADATADLPTFRLAVAKRVLDVPPEDDVWAERPGTIQLIHHAQVGVAWLALQGLEREVAGFQSADELLTIQFPGDRALLRDTAPFNTLERLTRWLGVAAFVRPSSGNSARLLPDPTPLVAAALDELVPTSAPVAMADVLTRSAALFPWLPHGRIGRAVADRMSQVPDDNADHGRCPQCLSLALVRLELEGRIVLEQGDDPRSRVLLALGGGEQRPVARVRHG